MRFTGSGYPSADRITLLRDTDQDGVADFKAPFIEGLSSPFGMALIGGTLFVANTDAVLGFPYRDGKTRIEAKVNSLHAYPPMRPTVTGPKTCSPTPMESPYSSPLAPTAISVNWARRPSRAVPAFGNLILLLAN